MSEANCCAKGANTLIFSCSGAADVGEIADRAARKLTRERMGKMFCLAGRRRAGRQYFKDDKRSGSHPRYRWLHSKLRKRMPEPRPASQTSPA